MSEQSEDAAGAEALAQGPGASSESIYEGERIAKAIARAGIASRRDAEAMIAAGRVTLNGQTLDSPAVNVTEADRVTVDGEPLPARERTRLWLLHKPRGVVTTARDPEGRQTVFGDLPEDLPRVVAIGRLDINTEGLLLLTNDGGLAKVIAHPETGWLRRYRVRAFGDVTQADLDRLKGGVTIDGMAYGPIEASLDRAQGDNVWLTLGLREGKNREVKRILEHLGLSVNRLIRLSFGPFQLGDLEVGLVEEIRTKVLKEQLGRSLAEQAGVDFESPVREPIAPFGKPAKAVQGRTGQAGRQAVRDARPARMPPPSPGAGLRGSRPDRRTGGRSEERPNERPNERPMRDPARPAAAKRVPTGGNGPGPRASIWRAEDAPGERSGGGVPRRGADPKLARASAAERGRERVGAIRTGERRVLVERLQPSPEVPPPEPHRRVKFRTRDDGDRGARRSGPPGEGRSDRGAPGSGGAGERIGRPAARENRAPRGERRPFSAGDDRRGLGGGERRPRSFEAGDERSGGTSRSGRPGGGRPGERSGGGFRGGDRPGGGSKGGGYKGGPPGERSGGGGRAGGFPKQGGFKGRPSGERSGGDRAGSGFKGGDRPGGSKSGGFKAGGRPGGRPGGKPGGGRPGGRPGSGR